MKKYEFEFEDRDIIGSPEQRMEMIQKTGQELSPCVEIDGHILADVSGEEVEAYMLEKGIVKPVDAQADVPTDRGCTDEEHLEMQRQQGSPIKFINKG